MKKKIKEKGLRPGEVKILTALSNKPLNNKEIGEATELSHQPNLLSSYLRRLQQINLIGRDIETRKYRLIENIPETLFLNDVSDFIHANVAEITNSGINKEKNVFIFPWVALTNNPKMGKVIAEKRNELVNHLDAVFKVMNSSWESFILSQNSLTDQKIIVTYKKYLSDVSKLVTKPESKEVLRALYNQCILRARYEISKKYNNLFYSVEYETSKEFGTPEYEVAKKFDTPEMEKTRSLLVMMEAAKHFKKWQEQHTSYREAYVQTVEKLELWVKNLDKTKELREDDGSKEEEAKLDVMLNYLQNKSNRSLYESFLKRLNSSHKTVFMYAFGDFLNSEEYTERVKNILIETPKPRLDSLFSNGDFFGFKKS
jgi:hypothetical protein